MVDLRYPWPTLADPFRRRTHSLRAHHRPGSVRFTWNARGALFQLLTAMPDRRGAELASAMTLVQKHGRALPRIDRLSPAARLQWEEENVRACLNAAREAGFAAA